MTELLTTPPLLTTRGHRSYEDNGETKYMWDNDGKPFVPVEDNALHAAAVRLSATDAELATAEAFSTKLWQVITRAGGPRAALTDHTHLRAVFEPEALPGLPSRFDIPAGQKVTLAGDDFETPDRHALATAYKASPRTWVFERANHVVPWLNHAAARLGEFSDSKLEVLATVYDSRTVERSLPPHWDERYSAIIQIDGAKLWEIGLGQQQVTTRPGDVLLLPEGVAHGVSTPLDPGHSRHVVLDLCRHTLYTKAER